MAQEIYIVDDTKEKINIFKKLFEKEKEYKFKSVKTKDLNVALRNIPELFIIDEDSVEENIIDICKKIRQDDDNTITPIIVISSNIDKKHRIDVLESLVEYYIKKPYDDDYLKLTIKNIVRLIYINRRVSPLTGLPGNVQIHAEMKKRLLNKEKFSVLYLDLDNFKAYNDVYGFLKGDEIIKFTARTISKNVHKNEEYDNFIGHIGGDDFVAIIEEPTYEEICKNIIAEFDAEVSKYFTEEDLEKGYLEVANRKCVIEQFPLTSISIGVVVVDVGKYHNILEIGEVGAQVKHIAKTTIGSSYSINRRK